MLGSLLRGGMFLALLGLCAYGAIYISGLSGGITLNLNNSELNISIFMAICVALLFFLSLLLFFAFINLCVAVIRFLSGDETAITRYFNRSRLAKGNRALSSALISFYEGNSTDALLHSNKAKTLLKNDKLSLLISAQIAKQSGNSRLALASYKKLLGEKDTRLVALSGIVSEKIKAGEFKDALELSKKNVELDSKNINNTNTLFNLQLQEKDWKGAQKTLHAKKKNEKIRQNCFLRQEALLIFEEAKEKKLQGYKKDALALTLVAVRQYPSFIAALCFLTELELMSSNKRRIEKLLRKAWALFPHPDIAQAYASLVKDESSEKRSTRFEQLIKMNEKAPQSIILEAELCLATEDFSTAKKLISEIVNDDPDNHTLTLMAAIERGSGATDEVVRGWLTKAVYAPKSFSWICNECGFQTEWTSICPSCEIFDGMNWKRPPFHVNYSNHKELIPLILEPLEPSDLSTELDVS